MTMKRRDFMKFSAGLGAVGLTGRLSAPSPARAQTKMVFKASDVQPPGYPTVAATENLGKKLSEATQGRLSIQTYPSAQLAGKAAEFDVTVKSIETPKAVTLDEEFAKSLGLESLQKLRDMVKQRLSTEHTAMSRQRVKRKLLDELDAKHKFTPPPSLVEDEFNNVWKTVVDDLQAGVQQFEDLAEVIDIAGVVGSGVLVGEEPVELGLRVAERERVPEREIGWLRRGGAQ